MWEGTLGVPVVHLRARSHETMAQEAWIWSDRQVWACGSPQTNTVALEWKEADCLGPKSHDPILVTMPTPLLQGKGFDPRRVTGSHDQEKGDQMPASRGHRMSPVITLRKLPVARLFQKPK